MSAAKPQNHSQKLAEVRHHILDLLLNNDDLADSILGEKTTDPRNTLLMDQTADLSASVATLHAADLADILEALPEHQRLALWSLVEPSVRGKALVEVSETVWDSLIEEMSDRDLLRAIAYLDLDDQVYLAEYLPRDLTGRVLTSLEPRLRDKVREVMKFGKSSVGRIMDFELLTIRPDVTLAAVQRYLRFRKIIPKGSDKLFVTDRNNLLLGELPLTTVLLNAPLQRVEEVMNDDPTTFSPDDKADDAASAFERYDLITAPVVDLKGKLMGRLTVESIVDFVNEDSDANLRRMGGISREEDVFSPVGKAVKNRWAWLAINLCTAFVASRVIGLFEHTISELVALAALMPIVAGIGGNTGNQTITMIVRGLALHQVQLSNMPFLLLRELGVALINGLIWGGLMGVVTWLLYGNMAMGAVMTLAMVLNLLVAALMGVLIPLTMVRLGRDPALGSSVMITALTDTGGFFIFLGLATIFLL
ncbi:magnesium transporter [Rouxiella badensis]|uniref:magnesium transporter n=1 Tax=Rouxiella badensis TaxID=1646377 RepID=UPI0022A9FA02|nr:magnesium transporter [Rouxiella badensis]WAT09258.1 magnesium transporter [Rouxiella badensis]